MPSGNKAPTANAGPDQSQSGLAEITLDGSRSSDPSDPITFSWVQTSGDTQTLSDSTAEHTISAGFTEESHCLQVLLLSRVAVEDRPAIRREVHRDAVLPYPFPRLLDLRRVDTT